VGGEFLNRHAYIVGFLSLALAGTALGFPGDGQDQPKPHRHRRVRNPHRDARHVARAPDPQHLPGVEIGLRQHEAGERDQQQLLQHPQQHLDGPREELHQHVHAQMQVALRHHRGAEERHRHHDEDLHLVGPDQRDAEQVAADDIGKVEQDRENEGQRQHQLDDARNPVESLVDHRLPVPPDTLLLASLVDACFERGAYAGSP